MAATVARAGGVRCGRSSIGVETRRHRIDDEVALIVRLETDAEQVVAHDQHLLEAALIASRFVELRQQLPRPCHLVVGVVDIDASSLAARCAPRRLGRPRLVIFISPLSAHTTAAASALQSPLSVPRRRE